MATQRTGTFGSYYGSTTGTSEPLSQSEMDVNAVYVYSYLLDKGWSVNAISAMLGNMQAESTINPGRWQSEDVGNTSMGFGLVQWTPSTNYTDWCSEQGYSDPSEMDNNLSRIIYEVQNKLQWIATETYNYSFETFSKSTDSVLSLAKAFLLNYERPADQSESVQNYRSALGSYYYELLTGSEPSEPSDPEPSEPSTTSSKKRKFNFILHNARKRRATWIK